MSNTNHLGKSLNTKAGELDEALYGTQQPPPEPSPKHHIPVESVVTGACGLVIIVIFICATWTKVDDWLQEHTDWF